MDLPEGFQDLFDDVTRAFLALATVRGPNEPVVSPVWFVADGDGLLFVTDTGAAKARDMRSRPQVAGIVMAEAEHERYVSVRGRADEITGEKGLDPVALYRRIVRRYEGRDPEQPFEGAVFRLIPVRLTGYDYRDSAL